MHYQRISEGAFARLVFTGRLSAADADIVREVIAGIRQGAERRCVIDLRRLDFMDSAGIGMLLVINGEALAAERALAMIVGGSRIEKVIELTRIGMIIPSFASLDDYIDSCVPEMALAPASPCAPGEDPLAVAARALRAGVG